MRMLAWVRVLFRASLQEKLSKVWYLNLTSVYLTNICAAPGAPRKATEVVSVAATPDVNDAQNDAPKPDKGATPTTYISDISLG